MNEVFVEYVSEDELQSSIQSAKNNGRRILALSPAKILRGKVTQYVLVTQ